MITFQEVTKAFGERVILQKESFTIKKGEFLVLVGPSGSGKTTLLKMIKRLLEPTSGKILVDGQDISQIDVRKLRLEMGYVLQKIALFPNLTVAQNIELIPKMKDWDKERIKKRTAKLLERVSLDPKIYQDRMPKDLSGGEQQRVSIVRALIAEPNYLLMDEPFSALDPISRVQLQNLTLELQKEFGITTVFVTHDVDEAKRLADRIAVLSQGKILQLARPEEIIAQPATPLVKELFRG